MLERLTINLTSQERKALQIIADSEMRDIRDQIRFLLRNELESRGLLTLDHSNNENDDPKKQ